MAVVIGEKEKGGKTNFSSSRPTIYRLPSSGTRSDQCGQIYICVVLLEMKGKQAFGGLDKIFPGMGNLDKSVLKWESGVIW